MSEEKDMLSDYTGPSAFIPVDYYYNFDLQEEYKYTLGISDLGGFVQTLNRYVYALLSEDDTDSSYITFPVEHFSQKIKMGFFLIKDDFDGDRKKLALVGTNNFDSVLFSIRDKIMFMENYSFIVMLRVSRDDPNKTSFYFKVIRKGSDNEEVYLTKPRLLSSISLYQ